MSAPTRTGMMLVPETEQEKLALRVAAGKCVSTTDEPRLAWCSPVMHARVLYETSGCTKVKGADGVSERIVATRSWIDAAMIMCNPALARIDTKAYKDKRHTAVLKLLGKPKTKAKAKAAARPKTKKQLDAELAAKMQAEIDSRQRSGPRPPPEDRRRESEKRAKATKSKGSDDDAAEEDEDDAEVGIPSLTKEQLAYQAKFLALPHEKVVEAIEAVEDQDLFEIHDHLAENDTDSLFTVAANAECLKLPKFRNTAILLAWYQHGTSKPEVKAMIKARMKEVIAKKAKVNATTKAKVKAKAKAKEPAAATEEDPIEEAEEPAAAAPRALPSSPVRPPPKAKVVKATAPDPEETEPAVDF